MTTELLGLVGAILYCTSAGLHLYSPGASFAVFMGATFTAVSALFLSIIGG